MRQKRQRWWKAGGLLTLAMAAVVGTSVANAAAGQGTATSSSHASATELSVSAGVILPAEQCSSLVTLDLSGLRDAPTRLTSAHDTSLNGTTYCVVSGYTNPQEQFTIELPETTWHGDYLQVGCGGYCGAVQAPQTPVAATDCTQVSNNEFVYATDDQGHEDGGGVDALWAADNLPARVTFGYLSEHRLRQVAGAVIKDFYGHGPRETYFDGCSGGGHEALTLAQRYPHDFNGILAGAPAGDWGALMAEAAAWGARSNMDGNGNVILTSAKLPALHAAVMKACANGEGYIPDPRSCTFDPASLRCPNGTDTDSCLTRQEITVVRNLYQGAHDGAGHEFFGGGEPYGSELAWAGWQTNNGGSAKTLLDYQFAQNYLAYMGFAQDPADFHLKDWKFDTASYDSMERLAGIYDATSPDLSAFRNAGGKLIIWAGWADQAIPSFTQVDYYAAVERQMGGFVRSQAFTRLYMVPGGYHCLSGGDPTTMPVFLVPLINWVENAQAPAALTLPVTGQTTGTKISSLTVHPFDALAPAPKNKGLNSNYQQYRSADLYTRDHLMVCEVKLGNYVCTTSH